MESIQIGAMLHHLETGEELRVWQVADDASCVRCERLKGDFGRKDHVSTALDRLASAIQTR